jgi:aspartate aminotransferase-like enzyme
LKRPVAAGRQMPYAPAPLDEVRAVIRKERPAVVFAPHVETAAGMLLPDDYLRGVAEAVHEVGGLFVLDCIASGALWVDMQATGVDVLVSAPQKGWSGSPCCAFVMLSALARQRIDATTSTSYAADLKKWLQVMEAYEGGAHLYHTTMPTDALARTRDAMLETRARGFATLRSEQEKLGAAVRALLEGYGYASVAAVGFKAPCVIVSYTDDPGLQSSKTFLELGLQTAAGVPLQCDEGADFKTFRIGLFGLEKLGNVDRSVGHLDTALQAIAKARQRPRPRPQTDAPGRRRPTRSDLPRSTTSFQRACSRDERRSPQTQPRRGGVVLSERCVTALDASVISALSFIDLARRAFGTMSRHHCGLSLCNRPRRRWPRRATRPRAAACRPRSRAACRS